MEIQSATGGNAVAQTSSGSDAFREVGMDEFIKLMITELQNQDPLNPMDNEQMLAQIGQIREIASNDKLTETLESLMLAQGVTMAGGLLGRTVTALSDENKRIEGVVDRILIEDGAAKLIVTETVPETYDSETGVKLLPAYQVEHTVSINNVASILNNSTDKEADSIVLPAQLSVAQDMIGKSILGVSQEGSIVSGKVTRVAMETGGPILILTETIPAEINPETEEVITEAGSKEHRVALSDVSSILSESLETTEITAGD